MICNCFLTVYLPAVQRADSNEGGTSALPGALCVSGNQGARIWPAACRAYAVMTEVFCKQPFCGEAELAAYCAALVCCLSAAKSTYASHYFRILRTVMSQKIFDFPGLRAVALCNQKEQKS